MTRGKMERESKEAKKLGWKKEDEEKQQQQQKWK